MPSGRYPHTPGPMFVCPVCEQSSIKGECAPRLRQALDAAEADVRLAKETIAMLEGECGRLEAQLSAARREALVDAHTAIGRLPFIDRPKSLLAIEDLIAKLDFKP